MFSVLTQEYAQERYGEEKRQEGWEEGWKEARAEISRREAEFSKREAEFSKREAEFSKREAEFNKREAELKEEAQEAAARTRREKALKIAKNFLVGLNLPLDVVAKYSELPLADVEELAKSLGK